MTPLHPHAHENALLRRQLDAAETELDHRANIISTQADRYARMRNVAIRRKSRLDQLWGSRMPTLNPRSTSFRSPEDDGDRGPW